MLICFTWQNKKYFSFNYYKLSHTLILKFNNKKITVYTNRQSIPIGTNTTWFELEGMSDWILPSRIKLFLIFNNLLVQSVHY